MSDEYSVADTERAPAPDEETTSPGTTHGDRNAPIAVGSVVEAFAFVAAKLERAERDGERREREALEWRRTIEHRQQAIQMSLEVLVHELQRLVGRLREHEDHEARLRIVPLNGKGDAP